MDFGYFYEEESEQFAFYRIPQVLFKDDRFSKLSTDAKVLYGLFLNRVSLSKKIIGLMKEAVYMSTIPLKISRKICIVPARRR